MGLKRPIRSLIKRLRSPARHFANKVKCPLCGGGDGAEMTCGRDWRTIMCPACMIGWTDPPPPPVDYESESFRDLACGKKDAPARLSFSTLPQQWRKALQMQTEILKRHLRPQARILDIGCGEGLLLEQLKNAGFTVQGVEASRDSSAAARAAGLDIITGEFPHKDLKGPYDAVLMTHVLEHIEDFRATMRRFPGIAPGGKLMLVQANPLSVMASREGRKWHAWCPTQHFWHFTPTGLEKVIDTLGWKVIEVEYSSLIHQEEDGSVQTLSRIAAQTPGLGDQFHLVAQIA